MLDHIEVIFDDMKPMMKKLKKKNYKENMDGFLNRYGHYFHEMTALTAGAEDKEGKAEEIASVFVDSVEKKFASPKKGRVDGVIQLDLKFLYDLLCLSGDPSDGARGCPADRGPDTRCVERSV